MATNNYLNIQIISRNTDFTTSGGSKKKTSTQTTLTPLSNIDLTASANSNYSNLPNAGNNETWYGVSFTSYSYYSASNYAPFGVENLQLIPPTSGLRFVIDLVHTETNGSGSSYFTQPYLQTYEGLGKWVYSPFNTTINAWVYVDENNIIKVYINAVNNTYFDQLSSAYRNQLFVQVIGHWESAKPTYSITNLVSNTTSSNKATEIDEGENYTNTLTPNDGYAFIKPVQIDGFLRSSAYQNQNRTLTANTEYYLYGKDSDATTDGTSQTVYNLVGAYTNNDVSVPLNGATLIVSSNKLKLVWGNTTANVCYILYEIITLNARPYATCAGLTYYSTINEDGTATITINNVSGNIIIDGGAIRKYNLTLRLFNCVLYDGDTPYTLDYVLEGVKYYFKLKSDSGFIFKNAPTYTMGSYNGTFALNTSDKTIATIWYRPEGTYIYYYIIIDNDLSIIASATLEPSLKYGFISLYNPTYNEVDALSKKRFFMVTQGEYLDLSQYIISFRKLYVDIPQIAREIVYFGSHSTNVDCNVITTDFIETDCGTITINELYNNSLDYTNTTIEMYLPFIGEITLNPNQVYGKQLHLVYRTNPVNGDCVAILYSDNIQIAYSQGNVSFDVPINFKYGNLNNYGTNDNSLYMCELTPYIEVRTNRQYQTMNNRLLNNNLWVQIITCSGYVELSDIQLTPTSVIINDEYNEIISLLQNGIIV